MHDNHHGPTALLATVGAATVSRVEAIVRAAPDLRSLSQAVLLDGKGEKRSKSADTSPETDHYALGAAGAYDGDEDSFESQQYGDEEETQSRARYSFTAEHPGELTIKSGEELIILENSDPNWCVLLDRAGESSFHSLGADFFSLAQVSRAQSDNRTTRTCTEYIPGLSFHNPTDTSHSPRRSLSTFNPRRAGLVLTSGTTSPPLPTFSRTIPLTPTSRYPHTTYSPSLVYLA